MDLLLRLLERRTIIGIAVVIAAIALTSHYGTYWVQRYELLRRPPAATTSPLAADMLKDGQVRDKAKFNGLYRTVTAEITTARKAGFKVEGLQELADQIYDMDSPDYRTTATERLNRLRVGIPQSRPFSRAASSDDQNPDLHDAPEPKAKPMKRRR